MDRMYQIAQLSMAAVSLNNENSLCVLSVMFLRIRVQWVAKKEKNKQFDVRLCISTALRWVRGDSDDSGIKLDLFSVRGQYCLWLNRLKEWAVWEDVVQAVVQFDNGRGSGLALHAKLMNSGAWRAKKRRVKLDIIFETADEKNAIIEQVRIRMSPWQLLYRRMKEAIRDGKLSWKMLKDMFGRAKNSPVTAEDHASAKSFPLVDALEEGGKGVNVPTEFLQAAATIVKKSLENNEVAVTQAAEIAQDVNEYVKGVTIVSSVEQILVIATKLAELLLVKNRVN